MPNSLAASAFLLLLAGLVLGVIVWQVAKSRLSPFQCLLWAVAYVLVKCLWRTRWSGPLPIPAGRGAIVICNHTSSVDPFFIQTATDRKVHWMVAREFCEHPAFAWFLRACEVLPVSRSGIDTASTKAAMRIVTGGGLIGMLPEGRINMTAELLLPCRPGAALVALKTGAAVIPCYIRGAPYRRTPWSPLLMPARVEVKFGAPLDLAEFAGRQDDEGVAAEVMRRCLKAIAQLAGEPDYEPRLAGRYWKPTAEEIAADMAASESRRQPKRGP
jgi:1-acyl-sn-glycerol-3-phosphate acyltransferase